LLGRHIGTSSTVSGNQRLKLKASSIKQWWNRGACSKIYAFSGTKILVYAEDYG